MGFKCVEAYNCPYNIFECLKMALNWLKSNDIAAIYMIHKKPIGNFSYWLSFHFVVIPASDSV